MSLEETLNKEKQYQKVIDKLCNEHNIPRIKVEIAGNEELAGNAALFLPDNYIIRAGYETNEETLYHEFTHYMVRLISVATELEEHMCKYCATGMLVHYDKTE